MSVLQEMLPAGVPHTSWLATGDVDIRTDLPAYNIYVNGVLDSTVNDITSLWREVCDCMCCEQCMPGDGHRVVLVGMPQVPYISPYVFSL